MKGINGTPSTFETHVTIQSLVGLMSFCTFQRTVGLNDMAVYCTTDEEGNIFLEYFNYALDFSNL